MRLSGKELANRLGVAPQSLSEAARENRYCQGYPVCDWARYDHRDWISHYEVPEGELSILSGGDQPDQGPDRSDQADQERSNPKRKEAQFVLAELRETVQGDGSDDAPTINASLVPHGTNVAGAVSAGGAAQVMRAAIENGHSTAVVAFLTGGGAVLGHYLSEKNPIGAFVGGLLSFGLSAYGEGWFERDAETASEDSALVGTNTSADALRGDQGVADGQPLPSSRSSRRSAENPSSSGSGYSSDRSNGLTVG